METPRMTWLVPAIATLAVCAAPASETVLLEFSAPWCGACRQMQPVVSQLAEQGFPIQQVNTDQDARLAKQFQVEALPTFVLVSGGREVGRIVGATDAAKLQALFAQVPADQIPPDQFPADQIPADQIPADRVQSAAATAGSKMKAGLAHLNPQRLLGRSKTFSETASTTETADQFAEVPEIPTVSIPAEEARPLSMSNITPTHGESPAVAATPAAPVQPGSLDAQLLAATVRLKVDDATGHSYGTGTLIDARQGAALILTCGHIFRDSAGKGTIHVDMFAPGAPRDLPGRLITYDLKTDLALVMINPPGEVTIAPVAAVDYQAQVGQEVVTVGCDNGTDPTVRHSQVAAVNKYVGPPNIEVAGMPTEGRSGGGLFTADGRVIGVCNAADPEDNEGLFSALPSIQSQLADQGLAFVYESAAPVGATENSLVGDVPEMPSEMPQVRPARAITTSVTAPTAIEGTGTDPNAAAPLVTLPSPGAVATQPGVDRTAEENLVNAPQAVPAELANLEPQRIQAHGAEVICVIRARDAGGQSQVIVLDQVSGEFMEQLLVESRVQEARQLTSARVRKAAPVPQPVRTAAGPAPGAIRR